MVFPRFQPTLVSASRLLQAARSGRSDRSVRGRSSRDHTERRRLDSSRRCVAMGALLISSMLGACFSAPGPYQTTRFAATTRETPPAGRAGIVRGKPAPIVDFLNGYLFSLPAKLLYFNPRLHDHALPERSEELLLEYLEANGLADKVLIRHNQWAPVDEWRRLRANTDVNAFYRYTIGLYYLGYYTLLPPRLFGGSFVSLGDRFNPYTNSISVYTSDVAFLLHEAGHVKDYNQVEKKGTWGAWLEIPVGALIAEYFASSDAVQFVYCTGHPELERSFYRRLIPAYGSYIGGYASYLIPGGQLVVVGGIFAGHAVGNVQAASRKFADWISSDSETDVASGPAPAAACSSIARDPQQELQPSDTADSMNAADPANTEDSAETPESADTALQREIDRAAPVARSSD